MVDALSGTCANNIIFFIELPFEITIGVAMISFTWYKSRMALKSHDDGEGRLVLLPAYQVCFLFHHFGFCCS
jgi:hypothetical protein